MKFKVTLTDVEKFEGATLESIEQVFGAHDGYKGGVLLTFDNNDCLCVYMIQVGDTLELVVGHES